MTDTYVPQDEAVWACVADGFFVGSRSGSFLGYVDRQADGRWRAFDAASTVVGDFDTHASALAATTAAADAAQDLGAEPASAGDSIR
ncbi:MAG: hypothetical protein ACQEW8_15155 [Actinomycetota bacterium]